MNEHPVTRLFYWLLQWSWGLLQNFCGLMVFIYLYLKDSSREVRMYNGAILTNWGASSSMGLGMFIFCGHSKSSDYHEVLVHEYGHTVQSAFLGPLFLPVIGIPSFLWAFIPYFVKMRKEKNIRYTQFYPESWANHLGEKITGKKAVDK